jgi:hypothetical protein
MRQSVAQCPEGEAQERRVLGTLAALGAAGPQGRGSIERKNGGEQKARRNLVPARSAFCAFSNRAIFTS